MAVGKLVMPMLAREESVHLGEAAQEKDEKKAATHFCGIGRPSSSAREKRRENNNYYQV